MQNEATVNMGKDNGEKTRWSIGIFWHQKGKKHVLNGRNLIIGGAVIFVTSVMINLFLPSSDNDAITTTAKIPANAGQIKTVSQLSPYTPGQYAADAGSLQAKGEIIASRSQGPSRLGIISRIENLEIPDGIVVKAKLLTAATDGPVKAQLIEDVALNGITFLPAQVTLFGIGSSGEDRLTILFSHAITSQGLKIALKAQAFDPSDQSLGLKGEKIGRVAKKIAASTALYFLGGVAQGMQETDVQDGVAYKKNSLKNALYNGASLATLEQSKLMVEDVKDSQDQISVPVGKEIQIMFGG